MIHEFLKIIDDVFIAKVDRKYLRWCSRRVSTGISSIKYPIAEKAAKKTQMILVLVEVH